MVKDRIAALNRLHRTLEKIRCGYHSPTGPLTSRAGLDAASRLLRGDDSARAEITRSRIRGIRRLDRDIDALTQRITSTLSDTPTSLTGIYGIGALTAAEILAEVGDAARFATNDRFAMANGTAPIEASSGRVVRHRLNRGGNRQLNRAIHTPPPSPRSADPAPKSAPTTNAASTAARANEKPSEPSNGASQTASGPASKATPNKKSRPQVEHRSSTGHCSTPSPRHETRRAINKMALRIME